MARFPTCRRVRKPKMRLSLPVVFGDKLETIVFSARDESVCY